MSHFAYYNEFCPEAAAWLRELIKRGLIMDGEVDERSITEINAPDLTNFTRCHFFAGIAGWEEALRIAKWPTDRPVWTGSCPCQPFSSAGKQLAQKDERHLWPVFFGLIQKCRPPVIFGEQVEGAIVKGWLDGVAGDLEDHGYAVGAALLQASAVNAPHRRTRLYFVADAERDEQPREEPCVREDRRVGRQQQPLPWDEHWEDAFARLRALDDGLPRCVAGTDAARNAIVPQIAAVFIQAFTEVTA